MTERARVLPLVGGPERLGSIFDNGNLIASACFPNWIHVRALSVEMDNNDGARKAITPRAFPQSISQDVRIKVPGGVVTIQEHRLGPQVTDCIGRRDEREGRAKYFITGSDAEQAKSQMN